MLPEWLLRGRPARAAHARVRDAAISSRVHAFLLALINGERSMRDMARMLVEQRLMSAEEAEAQVRLFLTRLHEDSETGHDANSMGTFLIFLTGDYVDSLSRPENRNVRSECPHFHYLPRSVGRSPRRRPAAIPISALK